MHTGPQAVRDEGVLIAWRVSWLEYRCPALTGVTDPVSEHLLCQGRRNPHPRSFQYQLLNLEPSNVYCDTDQGY